ncbi:MAG: hypothetical protein LBS84_03175 [Clostridiales bacterium]|jgi:hypothetical protein|nr:hypothetical protein [Clostridiales bacterium]
MSHFTVAVFTSDENQSIDDLLAPYDENIECAPYVWRTREELIQGQKSSLQNTVKGLYAEWMKDPDAYEAQCKSNPGHIAYLKSVPERLEWTDEQFYQEAIHGYEPEELTEDGGVLSTHNPKSKWDWYEVGGRWQGSLILKDGAEGYRGSPGLMTEMTENHDAAYMRDIDFEAMYRRNAAQIAPYAEAIKNSFYTEEYMKAKYPTEEEYIRSRTEFYTHAVITPDGVWHESGQMGWFGFSAATPEDEREWRNRYYERFIKPALEHNWYLTIVDCHI